MRFEAYRSAAAVLALLSSNAWASPVQSLALDLCDGTTDDIRYANATGTYQIPGFAIADTELVGVANDDRFDWNITQTVSEKPLSNNYYQTTYLSLPDTQIARDADSSRPSFFTCAGIAALPRTNLSMLQQEDGTCTLAASPQCRSDLAAYLSTAAKSFLSSTPAASSLPPQSFCGNLSATLNATTAPPSCAGSELLSAFRWFDTLRLDTHVARANSTCPTPLGRREHGYDPDEPMTLHEDMRYFDAVRSRTALGMVRFRNGTDGVGAVDVRFVCPKVTDVRSGSRDLFRDQGGAQASTSGAGKTEMPGAVLWTAALWLAWLAFG